MSVLATTARHGLPPERGPGASLRYRLVAATLLVGLLVSLLVTALQLWLSWRSYLSDAEQRLEQIQTSYVPSLAANLWLIDETRVGLLLDGIDQLPGVDYVRLQDDHGLLIERGVLPGSALRQRNYALSYVDGETFPLGTLQVVIGDGNIRGELLDRLVGVLLSTVLALSAGSLLLLWLVRSWVTRHLETMARYAQTLNFERLDTPLVLPDKPTRKRPDELDQVVASVNRMRETLLEDLAARQRIEAELAVHRERLEELVTARTAELVEKTRLLEQQSGELETRNQDLEAYAHTVAHDLKTPLTTILGLSGVLASSAALPPERSSEAVEVIRRTARKMAAIIDALLMLASLRRNTAPALEPLEMAALVEEVLQRMAAVAGQRAATIALPARWPQALGQPQWVEEVWANYLSNAIKYGGEPPQIELGADPVQGGRLRFWVRDHGPGLSAEQRKALFNAFARLDPRAAEGHGLGLTIVARIVARLGGGVGVEPAEGGGSRFWFTLPAADSDARG